MKKQKHTFNDLLRKFNKYRSKLVRLQQNGKNEHRQGVLRKHIERLFAKLQSLELNIKRKAVLAASCSAVMSLGVQNVRAQTEFQENHVNMFSLQPVPSGANNVEGSLTSADLDNDGDLDILAANADGDFFYYENTGTTLAPDYAALQTNPFSLSSTNQYIKPAFVDLDNDGDYDILAGEYNYGSWVISFVYLENTGTSSSPNFAAPVTNPFSLVVPSHIPNPTFGDFDGDGDLDMFTNSDYYENIGTNVAPDFAAPVVDYNSMGNLSDSRLVDLDNDGDLDVLATTSSAFKYFENTGTATVANLAAFVIEPFYLKNLFGTVRGTTIGDFNGDGTFDIIAPNLYNGELRFYENNGTISAPNFTDGHMGMFSLTTGDIHGEAQSFGDLDNDGDMDMIAEKDGDLYYYQNAGTAILANFNTPIINPFSLTSSLVDNPTLADIDADGDLDLFGRNSWDGEIGFVENTGDAANPAFAAIQSSPFGMINTIATDIPTLVDLDNDADLDFVSFDGATGSFYFTENTGSVSAPTFGTPVLSPFGLNPISGSYPISSISFGDLDNDGDMDLLCGERANDPGFLFFENTGTTSNPTFGSGQNNPFFLRDVFYTTPNPYRNFTSLVDLNADGDLDILSSIQYSQVFLYFDNISSCTVNPSVSESGITLTADQAGAIEYQWVDCDDNFNIIPGATNQTFTPTVNGNYACEVTLSGCSDFTECTEVTEVGLTEMEQKTVLVYPNPASTIITIDTDQQIESVLIFNLNGALVQQETTGSFSIENLSPGIYMANVQTNARITRIRLVKN
ncbi:MAG: hypothetical protein ACJA0U_000173 [Salibacteraceae bacterium]|jgi:hypothetical protein